MLNRITICFILFVTTWVSYNLHWVDKYYASAIQWNDATGYYAYLPATFIYHDLNFSYHDSIIKKHYNPKRYYDYRINYNGIIINKYYAGTALAVFPFFLVGHIYAKLADYPADGFSKPYFISINIASIVFLLIGLLYVRKILKEYKTSEKVTSAILLVLLFGTNLFYYASAEPCLSHVYSFAFISAFFYHAKKFFSSSDRKDILICSFCLGFIVLIRPVNGIIIFSLPFIAGNLNNLKNAFNWLIRNKLMVIISVLIIFSIVSVQLIIYKIQCGSFFIYSYKHEGFNWTNPQIINFLFSYKKGFFLYTPVALLSLPGFIYLWKKDRFVFFSLSAFLFFLIYVLSSWWNWWYGGSFSSRVLIDFYVFLSLLFLFSYLLVENKINNKLIIGVCFLLIIVCVIQTYQYRYNIIINDGMTKEHYWEVFLRVDQL